jgi:hypothetical protein
MLDVAMIIAGSAQAPVSAPARRVAPDATAHQDAATSFPV